MHNLLLEEGCVFFVYGNIDRRENEKGFVIKSKTPLRW